MRHMTSIAVVTLAVAVSAGVLPRSAQAAEASEPAAQPFRVAQNNQGPSLFSLLQDVRRLQEEVRSLRGQVDTLQYKLRQNEQGQRDLYENLDKRLSALENGGDAAGNTGEPEDGDYDGGQVDSELQAAYTASFDKLKKGDYDGAISGFQGFIDQHPESRFSDNAWYWLGEANYVKGNADSALKAFQTVVNRFSASNKVPDSLYKIGMIQSEEGQSDNARGTLSRILDEYPDTKAAELAKERLQSLGG